MITLKRAVVVLSLGLSLGAGAAVGVYLGSHGIGTSAPAAAADGAQEAAGGSVRDDLPPTRTNEFGKTYGALNLETVAAYYNGADPSTLDLPDLILVVGDGGREGYVDRAVLVPDRESLPGSPNEAVEWSQARARATPQTFPVYEPDGVTEIDTLTRD